MQVLTKRAISYLAPDFMAIHPIDHEQPEEDVLLMDLTFMSQSAEATMDVPSYSRWLEGQDQTVDLRILPPGPEGALLAAPRAVPGCSRPRNTWNTSTRS